MSVTYYHRISIPIPVCNRCYYKRYFWYATAVALTALVLALGKYLESSSMGGVVMGGLMLVAVGLGFIGTREQPLNMLSFNAKDELLTLRVYNEATATALLAADGAKEVVLRTVRRGYLWALGGTLLVVAAAIAAHQIMR